LSLVIRHANRMFSAPHYTVTCGLSGSATFFHIIAKRHNFWKKVIEYKTNMCFDFLYNFQPELFSFFKRDIIINIHSSACEIYPFFL